ncbi:HD-GYP domain-containing protein [Paenibacillus sp. J5C_2022]|uniref:HD-GYP domain-containing protein n=1 Tax=Paenibacillus sp. J5C2022 TaxID=2977129 RepID=UPI0021D1A562|nr:HD-GYP domain-containing protein [Paenibacillus sp. J5C2022]MCU6710973.1 HD-GYP domain-containing protein [Paenibacillus sp. J5C2022]
MGTVMVAQLKLGDKIGEDVLTPLGGVLFHKGTVITARDMEILQAFLVTSVTVESSFSELQTEEAAEDKGSANFAAKTPASPLLQEYATMVEVLRKVHNTYVTGQGLPVMDIRSQLDKLLQHIKSYNVLTFNPGVVQERDYLLHNSVASALTSYLIAQWVGLPQKDWMQVALAGLLKDIGNVRIDRSILNKPSNLTEVELEEMKRHTVHGYQLLKNVAALNEGVKLAALQHHEKIDGSGYPLGIDASKIHTYAKIVSIADIFHAMTLNRSYRKAESPYLVLEQVQRDAFGKLDPSYVRTFIERVTQFHNGTLVRLSDERIGEIVFSDNNHPTRPWVSVNGQIVNLITERQLHIKEVMR